MLCSPMIQGNIKFVYYLLLAGGDNRSILDLDLGYQLAVLGLWWFFFALDQITCFTKKVLCIP